MTEEKPESPVNDIAGAYRLALEQRAFEIGQLTNRNNFFMVFQGVLLAGFIQSQGAAAPIVNFWICLAGMIMSIFQAGMAGGAKYWQIRWEVAVKRIELMLLEDAKNQQLIVQLFTSDTSHLNQKERDRIREINKSSARQKDSLREASGYIDEIVNEDLQLGAKRGVLRPLAAWAIKRRYSVSKIPFWAGISLLCVWFAIWLHTFSIGNATLPEYFIRNLPWNYEIFKLVPLK